MTFLLTVWAMSFSPNYLLKWPPLGPAMIGEEACGPALRSATTHMLADFIHLLDLLFLADIPVLQSLIDASLRGLARRRIYTRRRRLSGPSRNVFGV